MGPLLSSVSVKSPWGSHAISKVNLRNMIGPRNDAQVGTWALVGNAHFHIHLAPDLHSQNKPSQGPCSSAPELRAWDWVGIGGISPTLGCQEEPNPPSVLPKPPWFLPSSTVDFRIGSFCSLVQRAQLAGAHGSLHHSSIEPGRRQAQPSQADKCTKIS